MRLLGINIPDAKRIEIALTYVYGIGKTTSQKALRETKVNVNTRTKDLTADQVNALKSWIEKNAMVEGELRQLIRKNVQHAKDLKIYRGARHARRLPVRGQRTKTNSRTIRGNVRKTAGSGKRKVDLK